MRWMVGLGVALGMAAMGCGGSESTPPIEQGPEGNILSFETEEFEVPPGDSFECFYTDTITDRELAVWGANGLQGPGGHHILAYYTEDVRAPEHHPCNDLDRVNLNQIAGSAGQDVEGEVLGLKENLALKVPAGVQLVLEAHYINTTGAPYTVKDEVHLKLLEPEQVASYVNYFVLNDDSFEVPPNGDYSHTTYCEVTRDFDMALNLPHMHEDGDRYDLEIVDEQDNVIETLRSDSWQPDYTSHPPIDYFSMGAPLHLSKGTILRQTCTWNNHSADPLIFPREMCVGFFYYFPGNGDEICNMVER